MVPYLKSLKDCRHGYICTKAACPSRKPPSRPQAAILAQMEPDMWYATDTERIESLNSLFTKGYVATARMTALEENKPSDVLLDVIFGQNGYGSQPFVLWKKIKEESNGL
jgi:hypothetical protein